MKGKIMKVLTGIPFAMLIICSCKSNEKFDGKNWSSKEDPAFPPLHRKRMLEDLTQNQKLIGMHYSQLIEMLGAPDFKERDSIGYKIEEKYGSDIDPIYSKDLMFSLSIDSVVTSYKISEWKR